MTFKVKKFQYLIFTTKHIIALYKRLQLNIEIYELTNKNCFCTYKKLELNFQADQFLIKGIISIKCQAAVSYKSVSRWRVFTVCLFRCPTYALLVGATSGQGAPGPTSIMFQRITPIAPAFWPPVFIRV